MGKVPFSQSYESTKASNEKEPLGVKPLFEKY